MLCKHCGKEINENAAFCPMCGTKVETEKICINCGKEIELDSRFCPHCGILIKQEEEHQAVVIENVEPELTEKLIPEDNVVYIKDSKNNINIITLGFAVLSFIMSCINAYMIAYYYFY